MFRYGNARFGEETTLARYDNSIWHKIPCITTSLANPLSSSTATGSFKALTQNLIRARRLFGSLEAKLPIYNFDFCMSLWRSVLPSSPARVASSAPGITISKVSVTTA